MMIAGYEPNEAIYVIRLETGKVDQVKMKNIRIRGEILVESLDEIVERPIAVVLDGYHEDIHTNL
jgi:hypothetical protein